MHAREDDVVTTPFRKSASPAGIATELTSLRWLAEAGSSGGADVVELVDRGADWLETTMLRAAAPSREDARAFGRALAMTHASGAPFFGAAPPGLDTDGAVLAELPSPSLAEPRYTSWGAFFAEMRLLPYLDMARTKGSMDPSQSRRLARFIASVAGGDFDADQPRAVRDAHVPGQQGGPAVARLHGDLWGGNVVWALDAGRVTGTLIDPSAHGGHAETDLAELAVFGSPHLPDTLDGYQEVSPLAQGWQGRVPVHQLHMLLVHVALFGGSYVPAAMDLVDGFA